MQALAYFPKKILLPLGQLMLLEKAFYNTTTNCMGGQANAIYVISHLKTPSRLKVLFGGRGGYVTPCTNLKSPKYGHGIET